VRIASAAGESASKLLSADSEWTQGRFIRVSDETLKPNFAASKLLPLLRELLNKPETLQRFNEIGIHEQDRGAINASFAGEGAAAGLFSNEKQVNMVVDLPSPGESLSRPRQAAFLITPEGMTVTGPSDEESSGRVLKIDFREGELASLRFFAEGKWLPREDPYVEMPVDVAARQFMRLLHFCFDGMRSELGKTVGINLRDLNEVYQTFRPDGANQILGLFGDEKRARVVVDLPQTGVPGSPVRQAEFMITPDKISITGPADAGRSGARTMDVDFSKKECSALPFYAHRRSPPPPKLPATPSKS
jgi:hypothetical protein